MGESLGGGNGSYKIFECETKLLHFHESAQINDSQSLLLVPYNSSLFANFYMSNNLLSCGADKNG